MLSFLIAQLEHSHGCYASILPNIVKYLNTATKGLIHISSHKSICAEQDLATPDVAPQTPAAIAGRSSSPDTRASDCSSGVRVELGGPATGATFWSFIPATDDLSKPLVDLLGVTQVRSIQANPDHIILKESSFPVLKSSRCSGTI